MKICRKESFNAAHKLAVKEWTKEQNEAVFGKCSNPNYHGHNYVLETCIEGPIDPVTGYVFDLGQLKRIMQVEIVDRFDHRNLNLDCPEFAQLNPTAENIAVVIWNILREQIDQNLKISVTLYETEKNFVQYNGM